MLDYTQKDFPLLDSFMDAQVHIIFNGDEYMIRYGIAKNQMHYLMRDDLTFLN